MQKSFPKRPSYMGSLTKCCLPDCWDRGRSVGPSHGCSTAPCTGTCTSNGQYVQHQSPQHHPRWQGRLHSRASMCGGVKVVRHQLALGWQEWDGGGVGHQDQVKLLKMSVNQGSEPILCQGSFLSRVCKLGKGLVCCNPKSFLHSNHLIFWIKSNLLPS